LHCACAVLNNLFLYRPFHCLSLPSWYLSFWSGCVSSVDQSQSRRGYRQKMQQSRSSFSSRFSPTDDIYRFVFSIMFSPTIMLLIGGFTIASALSKTNIDRILITRVLSLAGTKPRTVLLAFMCVSCFASMWIR